MRAISQYLLEEKGIDKSRMRISNYWKQGSPQE
jgi:NADPH-dependent ferric siderophore reductase